MLRSFENAAHDPERAARALRECKEFCKKQPPFEAYVTFKLSRYRESVQSTYSGGNEILNLVLKDARQHTCEYETYWTLLRDAGRNCLSFLTAVTEAARKDPEEQDDCSDEHADPSSNSWDILITFAIDQDLNEWELIEPGDTCSQAMARVLSQGTVDTEKMWLLVKRHLRYVFCLAFAPHYDWQLSWRS